MFININTNIYIINSTYDIHTFKSFCALESIGKTTLGREESLRMLHTHSCRRLDAHGGAFKHGTESCPVCTARTWITKTRRKVAHKT